MAYKIGVLFDANGEFAGDCLDDMEIPEGYTVFRGYMPNGLYKPVLVDGVVVEGLTQEEVDAINNQPKQPTELDTLKEENEAMKVRLQATEQITAETSETQQELLELLIDMEVI